MLEFKNYWWPVRYGLYTRKKLIKFASSYGGKFFRIRRPVAVFIATLLDEHHQETFKGTIYEKYRKTVDKVGDNSVDKG